LGCHATRQNSSWLEAILMLISISALFHGDPYIQFFCDGTWSETPTKDSEVPRN
jgi:hypothetical protein